MTKKIDEAVSLNVSTTQGEMSSTTTFTAEDTAALAEMLKNAGIAGNSNMFNGAATLTMDVQDNGGTMSTVIQAPDLRSIMQLLEPDFAATAGDQELDSLTIGDLPGDDIEAELSTPEAPVDAQDDPLELARGQALDDMNAAFDDGQMAGVELYDPGMDPYGDLGVEAEVELDDLTGEPLEGEIEEDADYDYRSNDVHPTEYDGIADRKPVMSKTKAVPSRSGDNPIEEGNNPYGERTLDTYLRDQAVMVMYDYDSGDFDTGLDSPSVSSHGETITINSVVDQNDNDITDTLTPEEHMTLEQECRDDMSYDSVPEAATPKGFRDYFKETADRNHVAAPAAQSPVTTNSLLDEFRLNELSGELKGRYIDKAKASKADHEKKASDLEDLSHEADRATKLGIMRPGAGERVRKWQRPHDRAAVRREKGLDRLGAVEEETVNEISNDVKNSYFKKAADQINQHGQMAQDDRELGNHDNADAHGRIIQKRAQGMNRAIAREEEELDEAGRADWQSKIRQYGQPYYLNTDCGFASLEMIMQGQGYFDDMPNGLATHSSKIGFTVLEIERSGKSGYNYITSYDSLPAGTPVTCITQTSTGQKFRPGKFVASFTAKDLSTNYDMVVAQLARLGITPSKKLSVKTFD